MITSHRGELSSQECKALPQCWPGIEFPDRPLVQPAFPQREISNFFTLHQVSAHTVIFATLCANGVSTALLDPFSVSPQLALGEASTTATTSHVRALHSRRVAYYLWLSSLVLDQSLTLCYSEVITGVSKTWILLTVCPFAASFQILLLSMVELHIAVPHFILQIKLAISKGSPVHIGDVVFILNVMQLAGGMSLPWFAEAACP